MTILPSHDSLFSRIYTEVEKLRNCGMNRSDVLSFIDKKEHKATTTKAINFWDGALAALKLAAQVKAFAEMPYFKEFLFFVEKQYYSEQRVFEKACSDQVTMKQEYIEFTTQIGKLKSYNFVLKLVDSKKSYD